MKQTMSYKRFVLYFMASIAFVCAVSVMILWYCSLIGEHNSFKHIVKQQIEQNALYGTSLNENVFDYKLELYKVRKPNILALGSSRVLQFKEEFFTETFFSGGNTMNTLNEGLAFIESAFSFHKPKLVILGLDIWYFNPYFPNYTKGEYRTITGTQISSSKFKDIFRLIYKGEFFTKQVFDTSIQNPYTTYNALGLNAIFNGRGFLKDGSYVYGEIFADTATKDAKFVDTLQRIKMGNQRFEYSSFIPQERMQSLKNILYFLQKNNVEVVIFIPPLAPSIYEAMQARGKDYAYIDELFNELKKEGILFYNYHNPGVLNNDNCEFIDGFHGGDVFYARILRDMANKDSVLKPYVKIQLLDEIVKNLSGKTFSQIDKAYTNEKDFLRLGCEK